MPLMLSLVAHKEVRFVYPLLPCLHVLASRVLVDFFIKPIYDSSSSKAVPRLKLLTLISLLLANVTIAFYTTLYHESGPLNVLSYLRSRHEATGKDTTVGFLMPCHSTPWRSHLTYPAIHAWALTCEPPLDLNASEKASYLDEADLFYANVSGFLRENMSSSITMGDVDDLSLPHYWPDYLVFFAQLEPVLHSVQRNDHLLSSYVECWRSWNTAWHHDWRRRGDIVVWCLDR